MPSPEFLQTFAGGLSACLVMVGMGLYLWQTVRGKIRPHAFTNVVNCVVTLIVFAGMLEEGAGAAA